MTKRERIEALEGHVTQLLAQVAELGDLVERNAEQEESNATHAQDVRNILLRDIQALERTVNPPRPPTPAEARARIGKADSSLVTQVKSLADQVSVLTKMSIFSPEKFQRAADLAKRQSDVYETIDALSGRIRSLDQTGSTLAAKIHSLEFGLSDINSEFTILDSEVNESRVAAESLVTRVAVLESTRIEELEQRLVRLEALTFNNAESASQARTDTNTTVSFCETRLRALEQAVHPLLSMIASKEVAE